MRRRPTPLRAVRHGPGDSPWLPAQPPPLTSPSPSPPPDHEARGARAPRGAIPPPPGPARPAPRARRVAHARRGPARPGRPTQKRGRGKPRRRGGGGRCVRERRRPPTRTAINHIAHARAPRAWPRPTPTPHAPRLNRAAHTAGSRPPVAPRPLTHRAPCAAVNAEAARLCHRDGAVHTDGWRCAQAAVSRAHEVPPPHAMGRIERPRQRACLTVISARVSSHIGFGLRAGVSRTSRDTTAGGSDMRIAPRRVGCGALRRGVGGARARGV